MINKMKKARTTEEARDLRETYNGKPHACIQWKGTDVCMDVHCKCGEHFHIDADFAYHVKCPKCKTVYFCNGYIELIELEVEPDWCVETEEPDIMETEIVFPVNNDLVELIRKVFDE